MLEKIKEFIEEKNLFDSNDKILVAVSGGRDSIILLYALKKLGYDIHVAHCNFGLRGKESDTDQVFVQYFSEKLEVPCYVKKFEAKEEAVKEGVSVQMKARDLRYAWFEELKESKNLTKIATAHHLDDQLETILINLTRGTGIKGLRGMKEKRGSVVRPLMCVERDEINEFLYQNHIPFREDSSNSSGKYFRNKIRHEIVPVLKEINPSVFKAIKNTAKRLRDVEDKWEEVYKAWKSEIKIQDGKEVIPFNVVTPSNRSFTDQYLRSKGFSYPDIDQIVKAKNGQSGSKFYGGTNFVLTVGRESYELYEELEKDNNVYFLDDKLPIEISVDIESAPLQVKPSKNIAYINADKVQGKLNLRKWREGDWFIPFGMRGKQKLSDFFINNKFSLAEKEATWLLCDSEKVVWVVGYRLDNRYKIDEKTKNVYIIKS